MTASARTARLALPVLAVAVAATTAAAGGASPGQRATTKSYVVTLSISMPERMWTPSQVKAQHPKSGEVMISGSMGGAMSMGGSRRHVEVQIRMRSTGKVVADAHPAITAVDAGVKNAMAITIPFARMQGVDEGVDDLHYGNNVDLVPGHLYRVTVTLGGERAVLAARAPR